VKEIPAAPGKCFVRQRKFLLTSQISSSLSRAFAQPSKYFTPQAGFRFAKADFLLASPNCPRSADLVVESLSENSTPQRKPGGAEEFCERPRKSSPASLRPLDEKHGVKKMGSKK